MIKRAGWSVLPVVILAALLTSACSISPLLIPVIGAALGLTVSCDSESCHQGSTSDLSNAVKDEPTEPVNLSVERN
jgi:hypothetical protein